MKKVTIRKPSFKLGKPSLKGKRPGSRALKLVLVAWIPFAVAITLVTGLSYAAVHQSLRLSANDPQVQNAEDIALDLENGTAVSSILPTYTIDIEDSMSTFAIIYDDSQAIVGSIASIDGETPALPSGVFEYAKAHGQDRFSWEPKEGVRSAVVVARYENGDNKGYVLVGRSLREVEKRINSIGIMMLIGWAVTLVATYLAIGYSIWWKRKLLVSNSDKAKAKVTEIQGKVEEKFKEVMKNHNEKTNEE